MPNVTLGAFNTITVAAASGVYRLKWPAGFCRTLDLLNVGAGLLYIRSDADPSLSDPNSLAVPANVSVNGLKVDGNTGLGVIASADTTISVRMT